MEATKVSVKQITVEGDMWHAVNQMTGYEEKTTFWMDFSIADKFGKDAILDTYERAFAEWKNNIVYITELVMVLNCKCWDYYGKKNYELSALYTKLYLKLDAWCCENLKDDDADYYYHTTD